MRLFEKKNKNVREKWGLFIIATVVVFYGIEQELLKGTNALNDVSVLVNSSFDDINFYKCVVDAYNQENNTNVDYDTNLSDEELARITYLNCSSKDNNKKIKSTKGLEKMISLTNLNLSNNELAKLELNNNTNLKYLDVSNNKLITLDISNNIELMTLYVDNNKLMKLDLSNNEKLNFVTSINNSFCKLFNVYKGNNLLLENVVVLPNNIDSSLFNWSVHENDLIMIDEENVVSGLSGGTVSVYGVVDLDGISYVLVNNIVNVIDIYSDIYIINRDNDFIYVGLKEFDINEVNVVGYNINVNGNKLEFLNDSLELVHEMNILNLDFGNLNVIDNKINLDDELSYDDFLVNISNNDSIEYKIFLDNIEVTNGNVSDGMILEIYYNDFILDSYIINVNN